MREWVSNAGHVICECIIQVGNDEYYEQEGFFCRNEFGVGSNVVW